MSFDIGDIVQVTTTEWLQGHAEGVIAEANYKNPKGNFYSVRYPKEVMGDGWETYAHGVPEEKLKLVSKERTIGKPVRPEDIRVGDKIQANVKPDRGIERPNIGVVAKIRKDPTEMADGTIYVHLIFHTAEEGVIYSTWWTNHYSHKDIILLKEYVKPHPVVAAKAGDYFEYVNPNGSEMRHTKLNDRIWLVEVYRPDDVRYKHRTEAVQEAIRLFDQYTPEMQEGSK